MIKTLRVTTTKALENPPVMNILGKVMESVIDNKIADDRKKLEELKKRGFAIEVKDLRKSQNIKLIANKAKQVAKKNGWTNTDRKVVDAIS